MTRYFGSALLLVAGLITGGCLQKEAVHTIHLSPDGAVAWTVTESDVFSTDSDPTKRLLEEQAYISSAISGTHSVAEAFRAMAAEGLIRTNVLRDERPFQVRTEARFSSLDSAFGRLFKEAGLKASVTMKQEDGRTSVRMKLDFSKEPKDYANPVLKMIEDIDDLQFVLTDGTFIAGGGFDVPDRRKARVSRTWMAAAEKAIEERREIELVLTWDPNGTD